MDLASMRDEYTKAGLDKETLNPNPLQQFELWFKQALNAELLEPNAMSISTVSTDGQPSQRTVLLKYFDENGFVFFTNYGSQKAKEIEGNSKVSMLFPWLPLQRQVRIQGTASKIPTTESLKYFLSRPRGSQLGAWVSEQSSIINGRQLLLTKFEELKRQFSNKEVPLPSFWGGYRVEPHYFEFWQGGKNRLHDRFAYSLSEDAWQIEQLAP